MGAFSDALYNVNIYGDLIQPLINGGFYQYLFPFMLVYAIVLTILNKAEIFKENKSVRVIIALVFAMFAIAFPITDDYCSASILPNQGYGGGCTIGDFMVILFPGVTAFTIGVLALYIVAGMLGVDLISILGKDEKSQQTMKYILGALGFLVVAYYYALGFGWLGLESDFWLWEILRDPFFYMIIVFGLIFWWVSSDDTPKVKKGKDGQHIHIGDEK